MLHAAGLGDKGFISQLQARRVGHIFTPKAQGGWYAHCTMMSVRAECLLLISSIASALGNVGQTNQTASDACLDGLALARLASGRAARALQLPFVGGAVMGASSLDEQQMTQRGLLPISLMDYAAGIAQQLVSRMRNVAFCGTAPWVALLPTAKLCEEARSGPPLPSFMSEVFESTVAVREAVTTATHRIDLDGVLELIHHVTGEKMGPDAPCMEHGLDSFSVVELSNQLRAQSGFVLSSSLIFDYPTARGIAAHLQQLGLPAEIDEEASRREDTDVESASPESVVNEKGRVSIINDFDSLLPLFGQRDSTRERCLVLLRRGKPASPVIIGVSSRDGTAVLGYPSRSKGTCLG